MSDSAQPAPPAPQDGAAADEGVSAAAAIFPDGVVPRFSVTERLSHWFYALFFLAAFVGGVLMWLPATREWLGRSTAHLLSVFTGPWGS